MLYTNSNQSLASCAELPILKIVGNGKVVQSLIKAYPDISQVAQIYAKTPSSTVLPLEHLTINDEDIVAFCCSIDELGLGKHREKPNRLVVLEPNLAIINDFIYRGYFDKGSIFVLSNPSEILAEYVYRQTKNSNVFALGLSYDFVRYQKILPEPILKRKIVLGGNHYYKSCVVTGLNFESSYYEKVYEAFTRQVESEFNGPRPPSISGAAVLQQLIQAIRRKGELLTSGFSTEYGCFTGGTFNFANRKFKAAVGESRSEKEQILKIAEFHKISLQRCNMQ